MPTVNQAENSLRSTSGLRSVVVPLAVVLAILGAVYWSTHRPGAERATSEAQSVKGTLHLESFVLNLADPGQRSYLRVGIDLGLNQQVGRGEAAPPLGPVRDTILGVLGQSQTDDLITANGKAKLKAELLHALQERVPELGVEEVYFTEFLIQR